MPNKKRLIVTLMIGDASIYPLVQTNFKHYAHRCDADFICITKDLDKDVTFAFNNKLHLGPLIKDYEDVLFLDSDIFITQHAPNIFEQFTNPMVFYGFNEGAYRPSRIKQFKKIKKLSPHKLHLKTTWEGLLKRHTIYFNSGVWKLSKPNFHLLSCDDYVNIKTTQDHSFPDQNVINYNIFRHQVPFYCLPETYNYMGFLRPKERPSPKTQKRFHNRIYAHFIHYAGSGFDPYTPRFDFMHYDYYTFINPDAAKTKSTAEQAFFKKRYDLLVHNSK